MTRRQASDEFQNKTTNEDETKNEHKTDTQLSLLAIKH